MTARVVVRPASTADVDALLALQVDYYREDGYPHHFAGARTAWIGLLTNPEVGLAWAAWAEGAIVGYVVAAFGYCLEYLGRDAFVDELYVTPEWRGRGLGGTLLTTAETGCVASGVRMLHLEVEPEKDWTREMYARHGFQVKSRISMAKPLP